MENAWEIEQNSWGTVLTLNGDWDLDRINEFSNFVNGELQEKSQSNFVVNLEKVSYIDSMALGVLINLHRLYDEKGGSFYLLNPQNAVEKIFKYAGVYKIFQVYHSKDELEKILKEKPQKEL